MIKFLIFWCLLFNLTFAKDYPQVFSPLGTPIYSSIKPICCCIDIDVLKQKIIEFQKKSEKVKEDGFKADDTSNKKDLLIYLKELRELKKDYDYLIHLFDTCIDLAILEENYELFYKLTSHDIYGLLKPKGLQKKALAFYLKNRDKKKNQILDKKLEFVKLLEETQELYSQMVQSSYSSNAKNLNSNHSVIINAHRFKNSIDISFKNTNIFDVTIKVNSKYIDTKADEKLPKVFVIKAKTQIKFATLHILSDNSYYQYNYSWVMGSKDVKHNNDYLYRLPYAKGKSVVVSQGFNGKYTHKGRSKYAVDFVMQEGSEVYAARDGIVVKIKSNSNIGGYDKKYSAHGNYITLQHNDGTFSIYYHLKKDGVVVKIGDKVKRGTLIGYSGNTGYSSGPHLHFAVYKITESLGTTTLKIKFDSKNGIVINPKKGFSYKVK